MASDALGQTEPLYRLTDLGELGYLPRSVDPVNRRAGPSQRVARAATAPATSVAESFSAFRRLASC